MPIEVRQLVIKSSVGEASDEGSRAEASPRSMTALKEEILSECKSWFEAKLQQLRER